ncbi:uncharacterized protein LOC119595209 [Penaeus monodon]|uniref:uncharacterized protein LOC119595209 n=1 Tax=Penaeus monodon TaxID=6687 RepID=UPI0018A6E67F|nr:uncharacterized protein LOC119595209 [Penaeus monodon]
MAERPMYPWLSPPSIRTTLKLPDRSPTLSVGAGGSLSTGAAHQQSPSLGSTLSLPLCSERSSSPSRTSSSRGSTSSSSSWSSQWSWNTLLSNPSLTEALLPPEACQLHCFFAHSKGWYSLTLSSKRFLRTGKRSVDSRGLKAINTYFCRTSGGHIEYDFAHSYALAFGESPLDASLGKFLKRTIMITKRRDNEHWEEAEQEQRRDKLMFREEEQKWK